MRKLMLSRTARSSLGIWVGVLVAAILLPVGTAAAQSVVVYRPVAPVWTPPTVVVQRPVVSPVVPAQVIVRRPVTTAVGPPQNIVVQRPVTLVSPPVVQYSYAPVITAPWPVIVRSKVYVPGQPIRNILCDYTIALRHSCETPMLFTLQVGIHAPFAWRNDHALHTGTRR